MPLFNLVEDCYQVSQASKVRVCHQPQSRDTPGNTSIIIHRYFRITRHQKDIYNITSYPIKPLMSYPTRNNHSICQNY